MKKVLLLLIATAAVSFFSLSASGQAGLAPDQNPNYEKSQAKYVRMADSLNRWHSSTQHEMYKAIDWLADRKEARADRREFRRQLRLERARWYGDDYYNGYNRGHYNYYRSRPYRGFRSFNILPYYRPNFWW